MRALQAAFVHLPQHVGGHGLDAELLGDGAAAVAEQVQGLDLSGRPQRVHQRP